MLIDPNGLLNGERIGECSDVAQLHFPRLLTASNGYGRIELNYAKLAQTVYGSMKRKPSKEELKKLFLEYRSKFLLFIYQSDGALWGQWDIPGKFLPRHKTARDRESPEPVEAEWRAFKAAYVESRRLKYETEHEGLITKDFGNVPKASAKVRSISESCEKFRLGIGIGVGVGVGENSSPATPEHRKPEPEPTDSRHVPFREAVHVHWCEEFPDTPAAPWDGSEAKALTRLLNANPHLTIEQFQLCLGNRAQSRVQHSDRPRRWLETITDYLSGPKDEFGKPLHGSRPREPGVHRPQSVARALEGSALTRDEEEELAIVNAMRAERGNGPLTAAEMYPQKAAVQ